MAQITVEVQVRKAFWFIPFLKVVRLFTRCKIISCTTARHLAASATNRAVKYRVDRGRWRKFDSPVIPFVRDF